MEETAKAGIIQPVAGAPRQVAACITASGEAGRDPPVAHFGDKTADPIVANMHRRTEEMVHLVSRTETGQGRAAGRAPSRQSSGVLATLPHRRASSAKRSPP